MVKVSKDVANTQALLRGSYDISSGGIPPHILMWQYLISGKGMDDYVRETFLSGCHANLLAIPGLTVYWDATDKRAAGAYFGSTFEAEIQKVKAEISEKAERGETAIFRGFFYRDQPLRFDPISREDVAAIVDRCYEEGYLLQRPSSVHEWSDRDAHCYEFIRLLMSVQNNGGLWKKEAALSLGHGLKERWFEEPFYTLGIQLHLEKLGLMKMLLEHATGKMKKSGFADPNVFDSKLYFGDSSATEEQQWQNAFQKRFSRNALSAQELLELSQQTLEKAKASYAPLISS